MIEILLNNLDIFFIIIMGLLYISFIFLAEDINYKFFIFFISSFINIFNYSVVLKNEYNFLTIVLLNIIFILIIIIFYIYSDIKQENLSSDFIESNDIKNFITIVIFLGSFILLCYIFIILNSKKNLFGNNINKNTIITTEKYYYKKNNILEKKEIINNKNEHYTIYTRNIPFIEKNNIFLNYNLIIILYITITIVSFFMTNNKRKDER